MSVRNGFDNEVVTSLEQLNVVHLGQFNNNYSTVPKFITLSFNSSTDVTTSLSKPFLADIKVHPVLVYVLLQLYVHQYHFQGCL